MRKIICLTCLVTVLVSCKKETKPFLVTPSNATGMWTLYSSQLVPDSIYTVLQHPCMSNQVYQVLANGTFKAYYTGASLCYLSPGRIAIGAAVTDTTQGTWSIISNRYIAKRHFANGSEETDYGNINNTNGVLKLALTDTIQASGQQLIYNDIFIKQ